MGQDASFVPEYSHRGLLGRSIQRCDQAFQEVHRLGMAPHKELVYDCIPREASETGEPNGENWKAQWSNHRLDFFLLMLVGCSPAENGERRWKRPTEESADYMASGQGKVSSLFSFRAFYDFSTVSPCFSEASRPNTRNRCLTKREHRRNLMYRYTMV